jgi:lysophospholipase L1-like esterase
MNNCVGFVQGVTLIVLTACSGSGGSSTNAPSGGAAAVGGNASTSGGVQSSGGSLPTSLGGAVATGGTSALGTGGSSVAVSLHSGGSSTGGVLSTGGAQVVTGGTRATGGATATGGSVSVGGSPTGGTTPSGGAAASGGSKATGGATSAGGSKNTGGMPTTGGSQAAGGTSAGGSSSYSPCAASPCKILPFGDSITHGLQSTDSGGYRSQLFKLVVAANQTLTFLGSQSAGPATVSSVTFPKNHEGHDGYTVDSGYSTYGTPGISSLIPSPAFTTIPDIVLLHIGTNDITSTGSASTTTSTRLDGLLTKIVGAAPKALIVVAQITPVSYTSADLTSYNSKIPGIVQTHASQGQHIISVDMSQMPKSDLASDGVHPNDQGYAYMANIWYTAIKGYLR